MRAAGLVCIHRQVAWPCWQGCVVGLQRVPIGVLFDLPPKVMPFGWQGTRFVGMPMNEDVAVDLSDFFFDCFKQHAVVEIEFFIYPKLTDLGWPYLGIRRVGCDTLRLEGWQALNGAASGHHKHGEQ